MILTKDLEGILIRLAAHGCAPEICRRGNMWRAHVNGPGGYWHDSDTPIKALKGAVSTWEMDGKPMRDQGGVA